MIDNRTVGKTIATLRQAQGLTQQQLAAAMNVSHQAVSKWENGAALPDIQTMVELTQLFGITIEQLLSGEIPTERFGEDSSDDPLGNIGKFFNGVINDIGNCFKPEKKEFVEAEFAEEPEDGVCGEETSDAQKIDLQKLLQMAPFMSRETLEEMLRKYGQSLNAQEIARFAPFVSSAFLEELIRDSEGEISWDTLRRVAPFLKKEMVDAFARTIALGEKYVRPASQEVGRATEDVCRTIDEVSKRIGKEMDRAVRKVAKFGENVVNEVTKAFDNLAAENAPREERLAKLRRSAFERALDDGRWDWIETHVNEIPDDDLKLRIIGRAQDLEMNEWLNRVFGCEDAAEIDSAIEEGKWEWLGERIGRFDAPMQKKTVLAAAEAGQWEWLERRADEIDLVDIAPQIADAARRGGAKMFAAQLTRYDMLPEQAEQMVMAALEEKDLEFAEMVLDLLSQDSLGRCCAFSAKSGDWDTAIHFSEKLDCEGVEALMQIAIDDGNFEAIDLLDVVFSEKMKDEIE